MALISYTTISAEFSSKASALGRPSPYPRRDAIWGVLQGSIGLLFPLSDNPLQQLDDTMFGLTETVRRFFKLPLVYRWSDSPKARRRLRSVRGYSASPGRTFVVAVNIFGLTLELIPSFIITEMEE